MDEKTYWKGRKSRKSFLFHYVFGVLFLALGGITFSGILKQFITFLSDFYLYVSIFIAAIGAILILSSEFKRILTKYSITESRVVKEDGLINKKIEYIPYQMVEKISSSQQWYERVLKIGSIEIDTGEAHFWLNSISHPERLEKLIREAIISSRGYPGRQYGERQPRGQQQGRNYPGNYRGGRRSV
ncbi:MAG: PH domain-containing protein [archaeon]|nr:MAG: PH domain-containing protein [archaeon]